MTKLDSKLPKHTNGLDVIVRELLDDPKESRVAVIFFDVPKITRDTFDRSEEPTVRIKRIEPLTGEDALVATEILLRTYESRVGVDAIPFDPERDAKDNGVQDNIFTGGEPNG